MKVARAVQDARSKVLIPENTGSLRADEEIICMTVLVNLAQLLHRIMLGMVFSSPQEAAAALREGFRAVEQAVAAEVKLLPKPEGAGLAGMLLRELRESAGLKGGTPRAGEAKPKATAPPGGGGGGGLRAVNGLRSGD
eukprot:jgi/Tetstr1/432722/TSEL_022088.t1